MNNGIPQGYKKDSKGNLVAEQNIKPLDLIRDEMVLRLAAEASALNQRMAEFKKHAMMSVQEFMSLAAQEYGVVYGGKKGNVSLASFSGDFRLQLAIAENIVFDEKINIAKQLIDECLTDWSEGSNANLKAVINKAFEVNQSGKLKREAILSLRSINIEDQKWKKAMDLISESIAVTSTREYIRFYRRNADDEEQMISLDMASL